MLGLTGWPCRVNSSANRVVLLHVQRNGDCGSPRVAGSTNGSSAAVSSGSDSVQHFRPPPGRRIRVGIGASGFASRSASSAEPLADGVRRHAGRLAHRTHATPAVGRRLRGGPLSRHPLVHESRKGVVLRCDPLPAGRILHN